MGIPESQLDIWAHQGSVSQSSTTYENIRKCLDRSDAPYFEKAYNVFLQGSYGNDTNIYADSDVDVVIRLDSTFYKDITELSSSQISAYNSHYSAATYTYQNFKSDVIKQLKKDYGTDVSPGKKAIFIKGNANRRNVDVLPAAQYRKYRKFENANNESYVEGIVFWLDDGTEIVNYPKQHSKNCTDKHQSTNSWFKPTVRIFKNMRNAMIVANYIEEGLAPSYFIEGMLYNVPNSTFGYRYENTVSGAINWLSDCKRGELLCANEMYYLMHPTSPVTWREEKFEKFLTAAIKYWNDY